MILGNVTHVLLCVREGCVTDFLMKREDFVHEAVVSAKVLYSVVYFIRRNHPFKYIQQCRKYSSARQMQVKILMDELKNSAISPTGDL